MPRLARLDAPGVLHHIIIRGVERCKIFRDDKDKDNFVDRLSIFKSIICQEDVYFKELVRYIHLNPLRAKIVSDIKGLNRLIIGFSFYCDFGLM